MPGRLEDLDAAFELPEIIDDEKMRALYEVLVSRLREEAKHMPMNTVQQLLIERICYNYIVMRCKERGELGGFNNSSIQKDFNTFWLTMTAEFNRMLGKDIQGVDRRSLLADIQKIIVETLVSAIPDPKIRGDVLEQLASRFDTV